MAHGRLEEAYERLGVKAYAARTGRSTASAYRDVERLLARQSEAHVLRIEREPVAIGSGARRARLVVLWPIAIANDNDND